VVTQVTIVAVTIFLHRYQAHRSLELHPALAHTFRFWLWLTTGIATREWVAVHRKHHSRCETADDPHSPQVFGIRAVLLRGAELYRVEAAKAETLERYGAGTPDDWLEQHLYSRHRHLGIVLTLLVDLALFGPIGLSVWGVQMIWIPFWAAGVINGLGHYSGYRTFATPDTSTNIVPWGLIVGGEELHNNHHAFPGSAKFAVRRWEIDMGWMCIQLLARLGLAQVKKVAPAPVRISGLVLDPKGIRIAVATRLQLLAAYRRRVLARVHRDELRQGGDSRLRAVLKSAGPLLRREELLLDATARERLREALAASAPLRIAFHFRDRLQAIWQESSELGTEGLLKALQEWCQQAEMSGVKSLRDFSRYLSGHHQRQIRP
jgi:stearoyl-CoA desaturase (delta-9 desaturase)